MDLSETEIALVEMLRGMGSNPLHVAFTSAGEGVAFTLVVPGAAPVAGWGASVEEAMSNAYSVPESEPEPPPSPPSRFRVIAGTDRRSP